MDIPEFILGIVGAGGFFTLVIELIRIIRSRKKDTFEFKQEQDQAPQVKEALLLNNTEKAVLIQQSLIDQLQEEIDRYRQDVVEFRAQLREKDHRIEDLTTRVNNLMSELGDIHGQLRQLHTESDHRLDK
jgi:flagellar biosynthesis chaperone FliJ